MQVLHLLILSFYMPSGHKTTQRLLFLQLLILWLMPLLNTGPIIFSSWSETSYVLLVLEALILPLTF